MSGLVLLLVLLLVLVLPLPWFGDDALNLAAV
jgi:hypothetical protein